MSNKLTKIGLFAAGAGAGAAIALLYAPRSGKHTRARLRATANRTLHRAEEVRDEIQSRMSEIVEDTSETIASAMHDTVGKVRERMNEGRERVEHYIRSLAS